MTAQSVSVVLTEDKASFLFVFRFCTFAAVGHVRLQPGRSGTELAVDRNTETKENEHENTGWW